MRTLMTLLLGAALPLTAQAATVDLFDWAVNVDGIFAEPPAGDPTPAGVNTGAFNTSTGMGDLKITVTGAGSHYVGAFFDHEIDELVNTFFNETGANDGVAAAGQSWEIDEPSFVNGDIFENLQVGALDNGIGTSVYGNTAFPDDVSLAMAWDFTLAAGETGIINFLISNVAPTSGGLVLSLTDPDSQYTLYLASNLHKQGGGGPAIPEPATVVLYGLGLALAAVAGARRRAS